MNLSEREPVLRNRLAIFGIAAASVVGLLASSANAYTMDASKGTGFVGKGEVQSPWGWNNDDLQAAVGYKDQAVPNPTVWFDYQSSANYTQPCEKPLNRKKFEYSSVEVTFKKKVRVNSTVAYEKRRNTGLNEQVTGFNLTGYGAGTTPPKDICTPGIGNGEIPTNNGWVPKGMTACLRNAGWDGTTATWDWAKYEICLADPNVAKLVVVAGTETGQSLYAHFGDPALGSDALGYAPTLLVPNAPAV